MIRVTSIGLAVFSRFSSLKSSSIVNSIEFIAKSAFSGCELEFVEAPDEDRTRYYFVK